MWSNDRFKGRLNRWYEELPISSRFSLRRNGRRVRED
jgi:hypothetical protein